MRAAVASFSNDSRSITWHQWHAEYPMLSRIGLSSRFARSSASGPHRDQSTGLPACCCRYGDDSFARRFTTVSYPSDRFLLVPGVRETAENWNRKIGKIRKEDGLHSS